MYAKTNQHCQAEDCLASIWNDLPQEFTDKATCDFERDFDFVLLQLADTLNTQIKIPRGQLTLITETFEVFTGKLYKV